MIEIHNLQKVINGVTVIDIPTLSIAGGEIAGLVGAAGSGIEVLFNLLTGHTRPTTGTIQIAGKQPFLYKDDFSRQVGILFAEDALYRNMTVRANMAFFARLYGLPTARIDQVLMQVGLADQANIAISKLSEGLQRRLALGRALLHQPGCLVLAEPFDRCDEATINLLSGVIRSQADDGVAVLILAASQARLPSLCDTIYLMNEGRISEARSVTEALPTSQPFKIPVRGEDKVVLVNPSDILYADASEGRAFLVMADGRLPTQFTLQELENRLARSGFFRAHRSFLVNLQHVKEVIPFTRNSYSLRLDDHAGSLIPLSKAAAAELKELLGY